MSPHTADLRPRTVHVPLHDFLIAEKPTRQLLISGVVLARVADPPALDYKMLGFDERRSLAEDVAYWLSIREPRTDGVTAASLANTWIFSLWLTRPTKVAIHYRFDEFDDSNASRSTRLLSRAGYNRFDVEHHPFSAAEIRQAASYLETLRGIDSSSRLGFALSLSVESTWVHRWSSGLMLASAAVESMLTYSETRGISARHSKTYATIVASGATHDAARGRFVNAYRRRSKLVHGRLPSVTNDERLQDFAEWSRLLRQLWREILTRPALLAALQADDATREAHFDTL